MGAEHKRMPNPEQLRGYFSGYIKAVAMHQVPGQDSSAAQAALVHEEHNPTVGQNRHYWIDYEFKTSSGSALFLRFQHAGHLPADNISWRISRGQVRQYMSENMGLMLLYSDGGIAWFNPAPSRHMESLYAPIPTMPNVEVHTDTMRASHGWLDRFLEGRPEDYSAQVKREVAQSLDRYSSGQIFPPSSAVDWDDAEAQLNKLGAQNFPEYLAYMLSELSKATGIMPFTDWVKAQEFTDKNDFDATDHEN